MKFEKPIAEIQKFDLMDVISASTTENTTEEKSQPGTVVGDDGGVCSYTKADNYDYGPDCL